MDASVIIPSYNRGKILKRCLELLFNQDFPKNKYEIIVVNDGSTDDTEKMIKEQNPPCNFLYLKNPQREGPSKSRNLALSKAKGKVVIFIDSDILTPPWFIKEHVELHKENPGLIVDGPAINITGEKNLINPPFESPLVKILAFFDFGGATFITANTSCLLKNLIKLKGFDEEFGKGYGWQDRELGTRLIKMGLKRVKNRKAYALHYKKEEETGESLQNLWQKYRERGENAILYYKKHPSAKTKKQIHLNYLKYSNFLRKIGWDEEKITYQSISQKRKITFSLLKKAYLIHAYAEGLKEGMEKHKIRI